MDDIDLFVDGVSETAAERLALELAREDQQLVVRLIELRKERDLSQEDIANLLGVSQATISSFERLGNDPHLSTVRRYARALGVMVRHHVDVNPDCDSSEELLHLDGTGISSRPTAAAVRRGLEAGRLRFPSVDWSAEELMRSVDANLWAEIR